VVVVNTNAYGLDVSFTYTDLSYVSVTSYGGTGTVTTNYPRNSISLPIRQTGLIPNTNYYFSVTPYNNANIRGTAQITPGYTTLNEISNLIVTQQMAYEIDLSFDYASDVSYVNVTRINTGGNVTSKYYINTLSLPIKQTGLSSNVSYSFIVTPYSYSDIAYNTYYFSGQSSYTSTPYSTVFNNTSYPFTTVYDVYNTSIGNVSANQMDITFSYASDVSYVNIAKTGGGTTTNSNIYINTIQIPYPYTGLTPDASYTFVLTPYSYTRVAGISQTLPTTYTLSSLTNVIVINNNNAYEIDISFNYTDLSYVSLSFFNGSNTNTTNYSKSDLFFPIKILNLTPNTRYNLSLTPYNHQNTPGVPYYSSSITTPYEITNIIVTNISSTGMDISFNYATDISYVKIIVNGGGMNFTSTYYNNPSISLPIHITGVADTSYNFILTPYNNANQSYNSFYSDGSTFTPTNYLINKSIFNDASLNTIVQNNPPLGIYDASMWNPTTKTLLEARGFGSGYDVSGNNVVTGTTSIIGNGAVSGINYLSGNVISSLTWPVNSIPNNFTLCTISRYSGSNKKQILQSKYYVNNWFHGHNNGNVGLANYDLSKSNTSYNGNLTDWLVMCGKNGTQFNNFGLDLSINSVLANSTPVGISFGGSGGTPYQLCIGNTQASDWNLAYVMIWNTVLNDSDMLSVSNAFKNYLNTGQIYKKFIGIYTFSSISNLVSTNITSTEIDISFNYTDLSYIIITSSPIVSGTPLTISKSSISLPIPFTGLTIDTSYNFTITPYNHGGVPGVSINNTYRTLTNPPPSLSSVSTNNITYRSVDISFNKTNVSYIVISITGGTSTLNNPYNNPTSPITISGLTPDTSYNFSLTPYNIIDISGTVINISQFRTSTIVTSSLNATTSTVSYSGTNYILYSFISSTGNIVFNRNLSSNILLVGGGGGGGGNSSKSGASGGGGGGSCISQSFSILNNSSINITIGSGGASNTNGSNSLLTMNSNTITAYGGRYGNPGINTGANNGGASGTTTMINGINNGGGGGGGDNFYQTFRFYNGGGGGAGGGGAGVAGSDSSVSGKGGNGGIGYLWFINNNYYAYGGGGGSGFILTSSYTVINSPSGGNGSSDTSGSGGSYTSVNGKDATVYGSGGGGSTAITSTGTNSGGSGYGGIVIIAIPLN
jgi:hypothetical protein